MFVIFILSLYRAYVKNLTLKDKDERIEIFLSSFLQVLQIRVLKIKNQMNN